MSVVEAENLMADPDSDPLNREEAARREITRLFEQRSAPLVGWLSTVVGSHHAGEDVAQTTMMRVWERRAQCRENLVGWTNQIGINVSRDHLRREQRYFAYLASDALSDGQDDEANPMDTIGIIREPSAHLEFQELLQSLQKILSPDDYATLEIVHMKGWSYKEASDYLDIPMGTVRSRLNRCKLAIAAYYRDEFDINLGSLQLAHRPSDPVHAALL